MKILTVLLFFVSYVSFTQPAGPRQVISLNGTWEITEGTMEEMPDRYAHHVQVPGLADMAEPAFKNVGVKEEKDTLREAFWYRRTLSVPGPLPAVVQLKVHKAMYGTRVYLNGHMIGEHMPGFTPGYFDLRPYFRADGRSNELVIRVGASRSAIPPRYMDGSDYEKIRYIPGIYDAVELICSGSPSIARIQLAPRGDSLVIAALIENNRQVGAKARVRYRVREVASGKDVVAATSKSYQIGAGKSTSVQDVLEIPDPHRWTPEDPFLYELSASTGSDSVSARFGMREFRFDADRGLALLNNTTYYLRGTNVTILRFFEDPLRGALPWDEAWVRKVIRGFKSMHWNSARYCIGFPPEIWYRVADEEGFLIEDEAPIWLGPSMAQRNAITVESLAEEFTEWMQERWNHPSVVIWDAQNESEKFEKTGEAIQRVRRLDLSNRPWENGWSPRQAESDPVETHTYVFAQKRFRMPSIAKETGEGFLFDWVPGPRRGAVILNEYGWEWLNRDGSPTTLSRDYRVYERIRPDVRVWNPALYREAYARTLAMETEFYRGHRKLAGVLHFCGLGYSRPDGQTSDNFIDVRNVVFEPEFRRYVGDAFAPVGLMIDFWDDKVPRGSLRNAPVHVINDLNEAWHGAIALRVKDGDRIISQQTQNIAVKGLAMESVPFTVQVPAGDGQYQLVAELSKEGERPVQSVRDFVVADSTVLRERPYPAKATASSSYGTFRAENVADGDENTRWSSDFSDPQWIMVDLGRPARIGKIKLDWEDAYAKSYFIEVSEDSTPWRKVYDTENGKGGVEEILLAPVSPRFVRLTGRVRGTPWGYSLYSFDLFPPAASK